jgi:hypothetical protein
VTPGGAVDANHELLARLIEILAPGRGDLVSFIEAYFDESGTQAGSPLLCVAGYVFEKEKCRQLDLEWNEVLHGFQLPYFHMVDCAHGNRSFQHLNRQERIECEIEMIKLIRKYMLFGSAVSVDERHYDSIDYNKHAGSAYSWLCWLSLMAVRAWADQNNFDGKIAYFFEAGHASKGEANQLMGRIFDSPHLREQYRYASHAFVDKRQNRPIQTADMLAWLFATEYKRMRRGITTYRKDLQALIKGTDHRLFHYKPPPMAELEEQVARISRPPGALSGRFGLWRF